MLLISVGKRTTNYTNEEINNHHAVRHNSHNKPNAQFLFKISKGNMGKPSYILGSFHTLDGKILDSIPEFLKAEAECKQLYSEYDISDQQKIGELQTAGQQATTLPDGKTIFDVLSKEQTGILNTKFNETFHINLTDSLMKTTWNYQPFVFLTTFSMIFTTEEMRKHPELGMTGTPMDLNLHHKSQGTRHDTWTTRPNTESGQSYKNAGHMDRKNGHTGGFSDVIPQQF